MLNPGEGEPNYANQDVLLEEYGEFIAAVNTSYDGIVASTRIGFSPERNVLLHPNYEGPYEEIDETTRITFLSSSQRVVPAQLTVYGLPAERKEALIEKLEEYEQRLATAKESNPEDEEPRYFLSQGDAYKTLILSLLLKRGALEYSTLFQAFTEQYGDGFANATIGNFNYTRDRFESAYAVVAAYCSSDDNYKFTIIGGTGLTEVISSAPPEPVS